MLVKKATGHMFNANTKNLWLLVSVLCAALYPNIVQNLVPELKFKTRADGYVSVHPSSVNARVTVYENPYLVAKLCNVPVLICCET